MKFYKITGKKKSFIAICCDYVMKAYNIITNKKPHLVSNVTQKTGNNLCSEHRLHFYHDPNLAE